MSRTDSGAPKLREIKQIQARIAQLEAYWLVTGEVQGSNPGKGEKKIQIFIVYILRKAGAGTYLNSA